MGRLTAQRGGVGPVLLVVLGLLVLLGWAVVGASAGHATRAAQQARRVMAGELAHAGVAAAQARLDARDPAILSGPVAFSGQEATGTYRVAVSPSGRGTFIVESVGDSGGVERAIRAELAPPPESFVALAGGSVTVNYENLIELGSTLRIRGDINAHRDVSLKIGNGALSIGFLEVDGDVRAGRDVEMEAASTVLLATAGARVKGSVSAGRDLRFVTRAGLLLTHSYITVDGPVTYGGTKTHEKKGGLGTHDLNLNGPVRQGGGVTPPAAERASADVDFYEALVADLERQGALRTVPASQACTVNRPTRVRGNLDCFRLRVEDGAVLVVDGRLDAFTADISGLVYVRGGAAPNPNGHVKVNTLTLLELIHSPFPTGGSGVLAATGNIEASGSKLAALLSLGPDRKGVLQILALRTGDGDGNNDVKLGIGGLADALGGRSAAPLLLYAGGDGDITVRYANIADAIAFQTLPLILVAGGDIAIDASGLADALGTLTLESVPEIWREVPPFLQGTGRARVVSWEWLN